MGGRILSIQMEGSEGAHLGVWGWGSAFWDTSVVSAKALGWQVQTPWGGRCRHPRVAGAKALWWQGCLCIQRTVGATMLEGAC